MVENKNLKNACRRLDESKIRLLHQAGLEIMARTGMRFQSPEALDLLNKAGAKVTDGNLARIPAGLVEQSLASVPKKITIYDRNLREAMILDGRHNYYGVGSDCLYIYDLDTHIRRRSVLSDLVDGIRLVDALPNLDFVKSMFVPDDVPSKAYERHQMAVMLQETTKPIVIAGVEGGSTHSAVEMAAEVAGGIENLRQRPFVINYVNPVSAFLHNRESLERLLYTAGENLPSIYAPGNSRGTTAPMSVAGMMALGNAGQLAGLVLSQLKREGSPFILNYPGVGSLDMHTMVDLYASPDRGHYGWELSQYYGLPVFCSGGASDAKVFDQQAAAEAALTLMANTFGGADMIENIGYLDSAMTGSLEAVCLGDEIIGWLKRYMREIEITADSLSLNQIHSVGPDGNFLETDQTLKHVVRDWRPRLFDRKSCYQWKEEGAYDLQERAGKMLKNILSDHRAEPLPGRVIESLANIVNKR